MKVSRERLSVIGRMIGIYREERRGNSQNVWTQLKFCEDICSTNTLKNIEAGGVARSMEVYEKLLEKFDLKLGEFPLIDEAVDGLIDELYIAIEYYDDTKIFSVTIRALKLLDKVKHYVYYSQLNEIFLDIRNYYKIDLIIDVDKIERYSKVCGYFGDKLKDLLILLMFARIKMKSISSYKEYENFIKDFDLENNLYPVIKLSVLHYYYVSKQRFLMMEKIELIEKDLVCTNNFNRLADAYCFSVVMLSDVDNSKSLNYIKKVDKLIESNKLSRVKIAEVSANIATYYYNKKDYENTLMHLYKAIDNDCTDLLSTYIIVANCQNHLNITINIPKLSKREMNKYPNDLRIMYQYFCFIQDGDVPPFVKIKMIMKHILPLLHDELLIDVFRFELNKLVEETNSYKTLYLFDNTIKERF